MNQYISVENLHELTPDQKQNLRRLWFAQPLDLAVAVICKNAETDEYESKVFVVGSISVSPHDGGHVILYDLRKLDAVEERLHNESMSSLSSEDINDDDLSAASVDFNPETWQPEYYMKDECLPLLSVGQLIALLQKCKYGDTSFFLTVSCEGNDNIYSSNLGRCQYEPDYEGDEPVVMLWECLKSYL